MTYMEVGNAIGLTGTILAHAHRPVGKNLFPTLKSEVRHNCYCHSINPTDYINPFNSVTHQTKLTGDEINLINHENSCASKDHGYKKIALNSLHVDNTPPTHRAT